MIFEQLFDTKSSTYTYIISSGKGREALIIDPVIEHTNEYIKVLEKLELKLVTGDTLLINGTGRTDFQNGSSYDAYDSLFNKLLKLPGKTLVYPAHDYNGKKNSTIENEKNNNPRLQVSSKEQYAEIMNNLKLANPKMMDVAVPANVKGLTLDQL